MPIIRQIPFVWVPAIYHIKNKDDYIAYQQSGILKSMNPFGFYKIAFKHTQTWPTAFN